MGTVTIRNLDDGLIDLIKAKAKSGGRSMESELRRQLEEANRGGAEPFTPDYAAIERLNEEAERLRQPNGRLMPGPELVDYVQRRQKALFGDKVLPSSVELFRETRDEDPLISPPDAGYP